MWGRIWRDRRVQCWLRVDLLLALAFVVQEGEPAMARELALWIIGTAGAAMIVIVIYAQIWRVRSFAQAMGLMLIAALLMAIMLMAAGNAEGRPVKHMTAKQLHYWELNQQAKKKAKARKGDQTVDQTKGAMDELQKQLKQLQNADKHLEQQHRVYRRLMVK